jgi:hypothetical protein
VVHQRATLPELSVVRRFGIPVTHPVQTLIDLATELKPLRLERAVNGRTSMTSWTRRLFARRSTAT